MTSSQRWLHAINRETPQWEQRTSSHDAVRLVATLEGNDVTLRAARGAIDANCRLSRTPEAFTTDEGTTDWSELRGCLLEIKEQAGGLHLQVRISEETRSAQLARLIVVAQLDADFEDLYFLRWSITPATDDPAVP